MSLSASKRQNSTKEKTVIFLATEPVLRTVVRQISRVSPGGMKHSISVEIPFFAPVMRE